MAAPYCLVQQYSGELPLSAIYTSAGNLCRAATQSKEVVDVVASIYVRASALRINYLVAEFHMWRQAIETNKMSWVRTLCCGQFQTCLLFKFFQLQVF